MARSRPAFALPTFAVCAVAGCQPANPGHEVMQEPTKEVYGEDHVAEELAPEKPEAPPMVTMEEHSECIQCQPLDGACTYVNSWAGPPSPPPRPCEAACCPVGGFKEVGIDAEPWGSVVAASKGSVPQGHLSFLGIPAGVDDGENQIQTVAVGGGGVEVGSITGGDVRLVTGFAHEVWGYTWLDDAHIVLSTTAAAPGQDPHDVEPALFLLDLATGVAEHRYEARFAQLAGINAGEALYAGTLGPARRRSIYRLAFDGSHLPVQLPLAIDMVGTSPRVSQNGEWAALSVQSKNGAGIVTYHLGDEKLEHFFPWDHPPLREFAWHPSGKFLATWRFSPATSEPSLGSKVPLSEQPKDRCELIFAIPDGTSVAKTRLVVEDRAMTSCPELAFSTDGSALAWVVGVSRQEIRAAPVGALTEHTVVAADLPLLRDLAWAPAGAGEILKKIKPAPGPKPGG